MLTVRAMGKAPIFLISAVIAGGIIAYFGWLASPPPGVSIDDTCQPQGVRASFSASHNGKAYWGWQLSEARRERISWEDAPASSARQYAQHRADMAPSMANADRIIAETNAMTENMYKKYPSLGPSPFSPAAKRAAELRAMADAIEREDEIAYWEKRAESHRLERIETLTRCEKLISAQRLG